MQEKIPVEVIVKFTEQGEIRPLKVMYGDKTYLVDKVYKKQLTTPKGAFGVALEYNCLIAGHRRKIYYDRYNGIWYVFKVIGDDKPPIIYNPLNYDIFKEND